MLFFTKIFGYFLPTFLGNYVLKKCIYWFLRAFRKNLFIEVVKRTPSVDMSKRLQFDLDPLLIEDKRLGPHFGGPTIIYCQSRENVNVIASHLRSKKLVFRFLLLFKYCLEVLLMLQLWMNMNAWEDISSFTKQKLFFIFFVFTKELAFSNCFLENSIFLKNTFICLSTCSFRGWCSLRKLPRWNVEQWTDESAKGLSEW